MLAKEITRCIEDMQDAVENGRITLEMQVRAYDLLDKLSETPDVGVAGPAEAFREQYYILETELKNAYNEDDLNKEAESAVSPFVKELEKAA